MFLTLVPPANMVVRLVLLTLSLQYLAAYQYFQNKIPNGNKVPYPCKANEVWEGVGHYLSGGTGPRNPFGQDFEAAGKVWTRELCLTDSDGDSMTNGEELGDPKCNWTENGVPEITTYLSHPGICDPWDSPDCMKKNMAGSKYGTQEEWMADMCKSSGFVCPAINETGVMTLDLRMPEGTVVPATETTYECMIFNLSNRGLPANQDFHMVGVTPILDNKYILHHMVLSGCKEGTLPTSEPYECGMVASQSCMDFLHVWTVGLDGECYHNQTGVKIGLNGFTIVAIQLHWNNPEEIIGLKDTSGVRLYYTPKLRPYDAGTFVIGDSHFWLAPHHEELTVTSTCSSTCTQQMITGTVNVTSAWNHMHLAGRKMSIKVVRGGQVVQYLTNDKVYSYNSPQVQLYPEPFQLQQGDALISSCGFNTLNRKKTTFFGEATQDEMCLGFLSFYPKDKIQDGFCMTNMGISICDPASTEGCPIPTLYRFISMVNTTAVYSEVSKVCRPLAPCLEECQETILKYMRSDKCMQGNVWKYIQENLATNPMGKEFLSLLASCKVEVYLALNSTEKLQTTEKPQITEKPQTSEKPPVQTEKPQKLEDKNCKCSSSQTGGVASLMMLAVAMAISRLCNK